MSGLTQEQVAALVGVLTTGVPQDEVVVQHQGTLQRPADTLALLASRFADGDEGEGIGPHSGLARGVSHASQLAAHLLALPAVEQRPEERGRNQQQQLETAALLSQLLTSSRTAAPAALAAAVQAAAAVPAGHPDVTSPQPQQQQQQEEQHLQMPKLAAAVIGDDAMAGDGGDAMDEDAGSRGGGAAADHTPAADPQQQQLLHPQSAAAAAALQVRGSKSLSVRQQLGLPPVGLGVSAAAQPPTTATQTKPRPPHSHHVVFVWDVEGCLLLLHSLVTGEYAAAQGRDAAHGASLGRRAQSLLLQLLDDHMHFSKLEDVNMVHISDAWRIAAQHTHRHKQQHQHQKESRKEDEQLAKEADTATASQLCCHREIDKASIGRNAAATAQQTEVLLRPNKLGPPPSELGLLWEQVQQVYSAGSGALPLSRESRMQLEKLWEQLDAACDGWLRATRELLRKLSDAPGLLVSHVCVGNGQLAPLLAKLLLFRLDGAFGPLDVYSAHDVPRAAALQRIVERFGPRTRYVAIAAALEAEAAAQALGWPFVRITLTTRDPTRSHAQPVGGSDMPHSTRPTRSVGKQSEASSPCSSSCQEDAALMVDRRAPASSHPTVTGSSEPPLLLDALGSPGCPLPLLTAEQLIALAESIS